MHKRLQPLLNKPLRTHLVSFALFAAILVASAFIIEHGFNAAPCHLCWLQRYGHWAVLFIALSGALLPYRGQMLALRGVFLAALYGFILGVYHSLVQGKYIAGPSGCSGISALPTDLESFNKYLENPTLPPRCDEVGFAAFGISLPVWNVAVMAFLMAAVYIVYKHHKLQRLKQPEQEHHD